MISFAGYASAHRKSTPKERKPPLIHLISIPVTNTSVNPARSTGVAFFVGDRAVAQLWLFWLAPIVGGAIGATIGTSADRRTDCPRNPQDAERMCARNSN